MERSENTQLTQHVSMQSRMLQKDTLQQESFGPTLELHITNSFLYIYN